MAGSVRPAPTRSASSCGTPAASSASRSTAARAAQLEAPGDGRAQHRPAPHRVHRLRRPRLREHRDLRARSSRDDPALADGAAAASAFRRPGHVFPLVARPGGVLKRAGHTEAVLDLARLAGVRPVGVISELVSDDGEPMRPADARRFADAHQLPLHDDRGPPAPPPDPGEPRRARRQRVAADRCRDVPSRTPTGRGSTAPSISRSSSARSRGATTPARARARPLRVPDR